MKPVTTMKYEILEILEILIVKYQKLTTKTLLSGNPSFDITTNSLILNATIDFILSTERFEEAFF